MRILIACFFLLLASNKLCGQSSLSFSSLLSNDDPDTHFIASVGDVFVSSPSNENNILSQGYIQSEMDYIGFLIEHQSIIFDVYPNPTNDKVYIRVNNNENNYVLVDQIDIINYAGKLITKYSDPQALLPHSEFDFSDMDSGIYFIRIMYQSKVETIKLIKI